MATKFRLPVFLFGAVFCVTYPKTVLRAGAATCEDAKATGDSPESLIPRVAKGAGIESEALEYQPADAAELAASYPVPGGEVSVSIVGYIVDAAPAAPPEATKGGAKGAKGRK